MENQPEDPRSGKSYKKCLIKPYSKLNAILHFEHFQKTNVCNKKKREMNKIPSKNVHKKFLQVSDFN